MIKKMAEVDVKEALKVVLKQIEDACARRKPVSLHINCKIYNKT